MFFSLFALLIVASGVWALVSPQLMATSGSLQPTATSGALARQYLIPEISQAQQFGVVLIRPALHKLGIGIDPERVFLVLMVLLGLMCCAASTGKSVNCGHDAPDGYASARPHLAGSARDCIRDPGSQPVAHLSWHRASACRWNVD